MTPHHLRTWALAGALLPFAAAAAPTPVEALAAAFTAQGHEAVAQARESEGRALERQAKGLLAADPSLSAHYQSDAPLSDQGLREYEAGLDLPLMLPGQRAARGALARDTLAAAGAEARALRWEVSGELRERAFAVALARSAAEHAAHALATAQELEADVLRRFEAGELPRADHLLARRETLARAEEANAAGAALRQAQAAYRQYAGGDEVYAPLEETPATAGALEAHPRLAAAAAAVARARAERERVRAERRAAPVLALGVRRERGAAGDDYVDSLGVGVSLPLGLASQHAPALRAAETALTEAQAGLLRARRELEREQAQAREALAAARDNAALAGQRRELSAEGLRLARRAFALGESDLFALLRAREQSLAADRDADRTRLEAQRAVARLNQALGEPLQ